MGQYGGLEKGTAEGVPTTTDRDSSAFIKGVLNVGFDFLNRRHVDQGSLTDAFV
jgi:hypothetical protein